jgi:hypothetical protein
LSTPSPLRKEGNQFERQTVVINEITEKRTNVSDGSELQVGPSAVARAVLVRNVRHLIKQ